jgi:hypothetical protein
VLVWIPNGANICSVPDWKMFLWPACDSRFEAFTWVGGFSARPIGANLCCALTVIIKNTKNSFII